MILFYRQYYVQFSLVQASTRVHSRFEFQIGQISSDGRKCSILKFANLLCVLLISSGAWRYLVSSPFGSGCGEWTDFDHFRMERKPSTTRFLMISKGPAEKTLEYYFTSSTTIFYPIFEDHFYVFKDVFQKILSLCMVSSQERYLIKSELDGTHMVYLSKIIKEAIKILNFSFSKSFFDIKKLPNPFTKHFWPTI